MLKLGFTSESESGATWTDLVVVEVESLMTADTLITLPGLCSHHAPPGEGAGEGEDTGDSEAARL